MTLRERIGRNLRARWRFIYLVTWGFKLEIFLSAVILFVSGALIWEFHQEQPHPLKALHCAMSMFTLQQELSFPEPLPDQPMTLGIRVVQALWFVLPLIGVTMVAEVLVRLGVIIFNRHEGREEWQVAVASTMKDHVVVVGFGHIGYRVVGHIAPRDHRIVVVEMEPKEEHKDILEKYDLPIIQGDARREDILEKCGIARARAIMAMTNNDAVNIEVSLRARELQPKIKVILRIFNEGLARQIEHAFDFQAVFSTTALAAPSFAAALWNSKILHTVTIGESQLHLARFEIAPSSPLVGMTVAQVEARHAVNVLLHKSAGKASSSLLPSAQSGLGPGDVVYVVAELEGIEAFDKLSGSLPSQRDTGRNPHLDAAAGLGAIALGIEEKIDAGGSN